MTTSNIKVGDKVKVNFSDYVFVVESVADNFIVAIGGLCIELSDVVEVMQC